MDTDNLRLIEAGWLAHVDPPMARALLAAARPVRCAEGGTLYGFGQPQDCLFGIVAGAVRIWVTMNEQEPRLGHIAGPCSWFGEGSVITGEPRLIEVEALGPTQLLAIDRATIDRLAHRWPGLWHAVALLAMMNQKLAIGAAEDLLIRNSRQRLAAVLLRLSSRRNMHRGVPPLDNVPITQLQLAEAANLSQSSTAALLSELASKGIIRKAYGHMLIEDAAALEAVLSE